MVTALLAEVLGDQATQQTLHETIGAEHAARSLLVGPGLDGLRDERDPGVEEARVEAAKGFAKGHVANDVEGGEVYLLVFRVPWSRGGKRLAEPVAHVYGLGSGGKRGELADQEVDVAADDGFLLEEGLLAKGVGEGAALARVVGVVGHGEGCRAGQVLDRADAG